MDIKRLIEEAFLRDSKSVELFVEISNLYSKSGDIDKAVNIKEILLSLSLNKNQREEVMLALAKDYHGLGMYDNAISVLEEVFLISDNKDYILDMQSHIYSELKEWKKVLEAQKLKKIKDYDFILFALCNYSKDVLTEGDIKKAKLILKEAELISKDHPHLLLHWVDIYLLEGNDSEIIEIGEKISQSNFEFFGIFLDKVLKYFENKTKALFQLTIKHIKQNPKDLYTLYVFSNYLFSNERYGEVINILKDTLSKIIKVPALLRLFIESLRKTGEKIDMVYFDTLLHNLPDFTRWFRCSFCGQEVEIYSFNCIRCSSINSLKPLWQK